MSEYTEKDRRIYYQDIVYKVCNLLDKHYGRKPGTGLVCGTIDEPSSEVQNELATLLNEHAALKREIVEYAAMKQYLRAGPDGSTKPMWHDVDEVEKERYRESVRDTLLIIVEK